MPERERELMWAEKINSRKYDDYFDTYYNLDEQKKEYEGIKEIFKKKKIKMVDEKKNPFNLKNAIYMQSGLDALDPALVKKMTTKEQRYPQRSDGLMIDPFAWEVPKDKKKKKK